MDLESRKGTGGKGKRKAVRGTCLLTPDVTAARSLEARCDDVTSSTTASEVDGAGKEEYGQWTDMVYHL